VTPRKISEFLGFCWEIVVYWTGVITGMVVKEIKANYHSYLNEIKSLLDPVINKMRTQKGQAWRGKAWKGPLKVFGGYLKQVKVIKTIQWSSLPPGLVRF
jgi:hypothetical protein